MLQSLFVKQADFKKAEKPVGLTSENLEDTKLSLSAKEAESLEDALFSSSAKKVDFEKVEKIASSASENLEKALLLALTEKIGQVGDEIVSKLALLHKRQQQVKRMQEIIALLNQKVSDCGSLSIEEGSDGQKLLEEAQELGAKISTFNGVFNPQQCDKLIENIKMAVEGLNVQNEMDLQDVTRFQNEQYNIYQLIRSIFKPLDEDKRNKARAAGGR